MSESSPIYKRLALAADGTVVFRATDSSGAIGIYRSSNLNNPIVSVGNQAIVFGASNSSVLYTDVTGDETSGRSATSGPATTITRRRSSRPNTI